LNQLDWLRQHRYLAAIQREHDWLFAFDGHANLVVECLWRLVSSDRIVLTSLDDGQQFGLPAPIDATEAINSRLENAVIESITIRQGTLDLKLTFDTGHILEVIPDSSGYEAWNLHSPDQQYIAVSGGDLSVFTVEPNNRAEQSGEREPPITPDLKS
jgi:hypothetical protein